MQREFIQYLELQVKIKAVNPNYELQAIVEKDEVVYFIVANSLPAGELRLDNLEQVRGFIACLTIGANK